MNINQLIFDENMEMYIFIEEIDSQICVSLSDGLYAYEEELTNEYRYKIVSFINATSKWYSKAVKAVLKRANQVYGVETAEQDIKLQKVFILFEQAEAPLFGLGFRTEFDIEHGVGLKINGNDFDIVEIGTADVAFC